MARVVQRDPSEQVIRDKIRTEEGAGGGGRRKARAKAQGQQHPLEVRESKPAQPATMREWGNRG